MRLAFWFQKFSRDELRRSPQAIANRGRWKNGDRQRSFRSEGVSWSPCGFACGNSKPVTTFPAGRRGFRGSIFSGRWKNGGCLVVPVWFCVRKFEACHHISSWALALLRTGVILNPNGETGAANRR